MHYCFTDKLSNIQLKFVRPDILMEHTNIYSSTNQAAFYFVFYWKDTWVKNVDQTHKERTTGSSSDEALSIWGLPEGCWLTPEGFRVLVWVWLASSSLTNGALALRCWLVLWGDCVLSLEIQTTVCDALPLDLCILAGDNPAAEKLDISERQSVSPGLGLLSTMLSGVTDVLSPG